MWTVEITAVEIAQELSRHLSTNSARSRLSNEGVDVWNAELNLTNIYEMLSLI